MDPLVPQLQWPLGASQPTQGKRFHRQLFGQETLLAAFPSNLSSKALIFIVGIYRVGSCSQSTLPVVPGQSEDPLPGTSLLTGYICFLCTLTQSHISHIFLFSHCGSD